MRIRMISWPEMSQLMQWLSRPTTRIKTKMLMTWYQGALLQPWMLLQLSNKMKSGW
jgi:hypothetical protein